MCFFDQDDIYAEKIRPVTPIYHEGRPRPRSVVVAGDGTYEVGPRPESVYVERQPRPDSIVVPSDGTYAHNAPLHQVLNPVPAPLSQVYNPVPLAGPTNLNRYSRYDGTTLLSKQGSVTVADVDLLGGRTVLYRVKEKPKKKFHKGHT